MVLEDLARVARASGLNIAQKKPASERRAEAVSDSGYHRVKGKTRRNVFRTCYVVCNRVNMTANVFF